MYAHTLASNNSNTALLKCEIRDVRMCYSNVAHVLYIHTHPCECVSHLEELGADFKLRWLAASLLGAHPTCLDAFEQLVNSPRDDALLLLAQAYIKARPHGVGLPRTRLKHISSTAVRSHFLVLPTIPYLCKGTCFTCMFCSYIKQCVLKVPMK